MWKLTVWLSIRDPSRQMPTIQLSREFSLPFPPFDGLRLLLHAADGDREEFALRKVQWDVDRSEFFAASVYEIHDPEAESAVEISLNLVESFGWRQAISQPR